MGRRHLFISYARADGREFARRLCDELLSEQFPAWLDEYEIKGGNDWNASIDQALEDARAILVVWTAGARASEQVESEWNYGVAQYLPILPLLIDNTALPRILAIRQAVDFRDEHQYSFGLGMLRRRVRDLDKTHLQELESERSSLLAVERTDTNAKQLQQKLDTINRQIAALTRDEALQRERIAFGMAEQRQQLRAEAESRAQQERQKVVGERPSRLVEYFKDRTSQRAELGKLLADPKTRVVSVIGRGGLGKTALASKVLADMEHNIWPHTDERIAVDGIVYLSTRTGGITLERLFHACARLLGGERESSLLRVWSNPAMTAGERIDRLLRELMDGLYVILLDNMEELLDDDGGIPEPGVRAFVDAVLTSPGTARLLITSRIPLRLRSQVMRFDHQVHLNEGLPDAEAIQLLRELDPDNDYLLRDAPEQELARIVKQVHGLPRALELIVGLLADDPFLTVDDVATRFYRNHDVFEALVEASYRRLDEAAKRVVQVLAVLGRPVLAVAVDFMLQPFNPGLDIPYLLRRLDRIHMVSIDRATKKVSLHPIDRDLAYNDVPESGDYSRANLEKRAADYYRQLRIPRTLWRTIEDLELHLWEFEHSLLADDVERAAGVLDEIDVDALIWHGHAERVLTMRQRLEGRIQEPHHVLRQFYSLGHTRLILGPIVEAVQQFRRAYDMAVELDDADLVRRSGGFLGEALRRSGAYQEAEPHIQEVVAAYSLLGDAREEAWWLFLLSLLHTAEGDAQRGLKESKRALELAEQSGDPLVRGRAHNGISLAYLALRDSRAALEHAEHAIQMYTVANWIDGFGYLHNMQGVAWMQLDDHAQAIKCLSRARDDGHEYGQPRIETMALLNLGFLYYKDGNSGAARELAARATTLSIRTGMVEQEAAKALGRLTNHDGAQSGSADLVREYANAARHTPDLYRESDWV